MTDNSTVAKSDETASTPTSTYFCVGSSYRTANIELRETLFIEPDLLPERLKNTLKRFNIHELAVLSTCNRCEVFGVIQDAAMNTKDFLLAVYDSIHSPKNVINSNERSKNNSDHLYTYFGMDAIRHILTVVTSVDSLVPGETQITGQFKESIAIAKESGSLGSLLGRLAQEALATAKKVRTNTDIGRHKVSISHAAIDLAKRASSDLSKLRFLIIGAGEMARVAAEYASTYRPASLIIANRTRQKAAELTKNLGMGEPQGLDDLHHLISKVDIVISATSSSSYVIQPNDILRAMKTRNSGPLFLIDIALPRDIDPQIAKIDSVYLFDIDDLRSVVDANMEKRKDAILAAQDIIDDCAKNFEQWLETHEMSPALSSAANYYQELLNREIQRTINKEIFSNLTSKQRQALLALQDSIVSKLTSDVAHALKGAKDRDSRSLANIMTMIFNKD